MIIIRIIQVFKYGWQHSKEVSLRFNKHRLQIFADMIYCYIKYRLWSNHYVREKFWSLGKKDRQVIGNKYYKRNVRIDNWYRDFYANNRFITKYASKSYENSLTKRKKRLKAYSRRYNIGKGAYIESGISIMRQHYSLSEISFGEKIHLGRDIDLDFTGGLVIGNGVNILEGVKILTHGHDFFGHYDEEELIEGSNRAFKTPLKIGDNVIIGARSFIMPGVKEIGENSIISAGSIITKKIPANCIVAGNPAKIVAKLEPGMRIYFDYQ